MDTNGPFIAGRLGANGTDLPTKRPPQLLKLTIPAALRLQLPCKHCEEEEGNTVGKPHKCFQSQGHSKQNLIEHASCLLSGRGISTLNFFQAGFAKVTVSLP